MELSLTNLKALSQKQDNLIIYILQMGKLRQHALVPTSPSRPEVVKPRT